MRLRPFLILLVVLFAIGAQAQYQVAPTGDCWTDIYNIQNAIWWTYGYTPIELLPGDFNFTCLGPGETGVYFYNIGVPIHIFGTPGMTRIIGSGPGVTQVHGFAIYDSGTTVEGITFEGFRYAIWIGSTSPGYPNPVGVTIQNCTFNDNFRAVRANHHSYDFHLLANTFEVGPGQGAANISEGSDRILALNNVVNGTGPSVVLSKPEDLLTQAVAYSWGIFQIEANGASSSFGRISNNRITGVDVGIQSSSDFAVVSENVIRNSMVGISVSDDNYDGVSMVTDGLIAHNDVSGNQAGIWVNGGARNIIESNDATRDSVVGVVFLSLPGTPPSAQNIYFHNQGSVKGLSGNQGRSLVHLLDD